MMDSPSIVFTCAPAAPPAKSSTEPAKTIVLKVVMRISLSEWARTGRRRRASRREARVRQRRRRTTPVDSPMRHGTCLNSDVPKGPRGPTLQEPGPRTRCQLLPDSPVLFACLPAASSRPRDSSQHMVVRGRGVSVRPSSGRSPHLVRPPTLPAPPAPPPVDSRPISQQSSRRLEETAGPLLAEGDAASYCDTNKDS